MDFKEQREEPEGKGKRTNGGLHVKLRPLGAHVTVIYRCSLTKEEGIQ